MDSGLVQGFVDAIKLCNRGALPALLDRVHGPNSDFSRDLFFSLPPTLDAPPYWGQCKLLQYRHLRAGSSARIRVPQTNVLLLGMQVSTAPSRDLLVACRMPY